LDATGRIIRKRLDRAPERPLRTGGAVGGFLTETGDVVFLPVARVLRIRQKLITAALVAALSMADAAGARAAPPAESGARRGSSRIRVSAKVASSATIRMLGQPSNITITGKDIARGYVDAPAASRIEVRSNTPHGCLPVFGDSNGPFRETVVRGSEREIQIGPGIGCVPIPRTRGPFTMELGYRFYLSGDARPGTYDWPLTIPSWSY
jgi:hypothetical protein